MSLFGHELAHKPGLPAKARLYARLFGNPNLSETMRAVAFRGATGDLDLSGKDILDAGCGWGPYSYDLARRFPTARVRGVEASPNTIRKNRAIRDALGLKNLEFEAMDLGDFSERERYDFALLIDVLEHIPDDLGAARRVAGALRPGGLLYAHVPTDRYRAFFNRRYAAAMDGFPEHVRSGYSPATLRALLESAGLEVLRTGRGMRFVSSLVMETLGSVPVLSDSRLFSALAAIPARYLLPLDRLCPASWGNTTWALARRPASPQMAPAGVGAAA